MRNRDSNGGPFVLRAHELYLAGLEALDSDSWIRTLEERVKRIRKDAPQDELHRRNRARDRSRLLETAPILHFPSSHSPNRTAIRSGEIVFRSLDYDIYDSNRAINCRAGDRPTAETGGQPANRSAIFITVAELRTVACTARSFSSAGPEKGESEKRVAQSQ